MFVPTAGEVCGPRFLRRSRAILRNSKKCSDSSRWDYGWARTFGLPERIALQGGRARPTSVLTKVLGEAFDCDACAYNRFVTLTRCTRSDLHVSMNEPVGGMARVQGLDLRFRGVG